MKATARVLGILIAVLVVARPSHAETIVITSGFLEWIRPASLPTVQLAGEGFTFTGIGRTGVFQPHYFCGEPRCVAGVTVDLHAYWSDSDLPGTATYNGTTFAPVGGPNATSRLEARWTGSLLIPEDFSGGALAAPFQFAGAFRYPGGRLDLVGSGETTLNFTPFPDPNYPGAFWLSSIRYEFDAAAPVPEPTSMLLIGTGLAGLAALRRRRARARDFES